MSYAEVYRDGHVHVLADKCATCIFRPGNLMHLQRGRVKGMVNACRQDDGVIPCHKTILGSPHPPAICRGYYDAYAKTNWILRLAEELGVVREQPTP